MLIKFFVLFFALFIGVNAHPAQTSKNTVFHTSTLTAYIGSSIDPTVRTGQLEFIVFGRGLRVLSSIFFGGVMALEAGPWPPPLVAGTSLFLIFQLLGSVADSVSEPSYCLTGSDRTYELILNRKDSRLLARAIQGKSLLIEVEPGKEVLGVAHTAILYGTPDGWHIELELYFQDGEKYKARYPLSNIRRPTFIERCAISLGLS